MNATLDFTKLNDRSFRRWVDKDLSSNEYKNLYNTNDAFRNRVNGNPWDSTPNVRDARPVEINPKSELGQMIQADKEEAERPLKEAIKEFEEQAQALAIEMRDDLKRRLDNSTGLTNPLVKFFLTDAEFKNLPTFSQAGGGGSFTPADRLEINKAYKEFCADVDREFTPEEQSMLLRTLVDAAPLGQSLSPMHKRNWKCAFLLAKTVGRISHKAAPKAEEKPKVNLTPAPPTTADLKRAHRTEIVFKHKGREYTQRDIDACGSDEFKELVRAGYTKDGPLLTHTDQLRPGRSN